MLASAPDPGNTRNPSLACRSRTKARCGRLANRRPQHGSRLLRFPQHHARQQNLPGVSSPPRRIDATAHATNAARRALIPLPSQRDWIRYALSSPGAGSGPAYTRHELHGYSASTTVSLRSLRRHRTNRWSWLSTSTKACTSVPNCRGNSATHPT